MKKAAMVIGFISFALLCRGVYLFAGSNFENIIIVESAYYFYSASGGFLIAALFLLKGKKLFPLAAALKLKPMGLTPKHYDNMNLKGKMGDYSIRLRQRIIRVEDEIAQLNYRLKIKIKNPKDYFMAVAKDTTLGPLRLTMAKMFVSVPDLDGVKAYGSDKSVLTFAISLPLADIFGPIAHVQNIEIRDNNLIVRFVIAPDDVATGKQIVAKAAEIATLFETDAINKEQPNDKPQPPLQPEPNPSAQGESKEA